eukprot:GHRQ01031731.1.p1 GENE.GHRQ01031731.1~~GHRQ01031731.1.p1  ORF type:complete len:124 (-),score=6.05 GHRQ01031731.1:262-633(-)
MDVVLDILVSWKLHSQPNVHHETPEASHPQESRHLATAANPGRFRFNQVGTRRSKEADQVMTCMRFVAAKMYTPSSSATLLNWMSSSVRSLRAPASVLPCLDCPILSTSSCKHRWSGCYGLNG